MKNITGADYAAEAMRVFGYQGIRQGKAEDKQGSAYMADHVREAETTLAAHAKDRNSFFAKKKTKKPDHMELWRAERRSQKSSEGEMETFKNEFYEELSKITKHSTVSHSAVNISEEAFRAMKEDPAYREKVLSLIQRDLGSSYAPRNCSVLITVGSSLEEYRGDSWSVGNDSEFWVRSRNSFYKSEKEDKEKDYLELYQEYLKLRYGNVMIQSVGRDQRSMDRLGAGTAGMGNVVIAPNILEEMAKNPEKAAYYEGKIQDYYDSLPRVKEELSMMGHEIHSSGVVIHEDGTVTYYISGDLKPEVRARIEARMKAEAEEKAKRRKRYQKLSEEAAAQRHQRQRREMERIYHIDSLDTFYNMPWLTGGSIEYERRDVL